MECFLISNIFQSCKFLLWEYNFFSKGIALNVALMMARLTVLLPDTTNPQLKSLSEKASHHK